MDVGCEILDILSPSIGEDWRVSELNIKFF